MPTYKRPGVYVEELRAPAATPATPDSTPAIAAFVGPALQGPTIPTLVTSWRQFYTLFGAFSPNSDLAIQVYQFFANGGRAAYVQRIASATAVVASRNLLDRAGTPLQTLKVSAANTGAWGNNLSIEINDGAVTTGTSATFNVLVWQTNAQGLTVLVERYNEVTLDQTSSRYVVPVINSQSQFIVVQDLLSVTAAPTNRPAAAVGTLLALSSGSDGAVIAYSDYGTAFSVSGTAPLDLIRFPLILSLPGIQRLSSANSTLVYNAAIAYAQYRTDTFVIIDTPSGLTAATAVTYAAGLTVSDRAAVYWPWVQIADPLTNAPGALRTVSATGSIAGFYQYNDSNYGVWKTPAGVGSRLVGVVNPEVQLGNTDLETLNTAPVPVDAIRTVPIVGTVIMGGKTLDQSGYATKYVGGRRALIGIEKAISDATQFAVFEPNDALLWSRLRSTVDQILSSLWAAGGLKGTSPAQAYYVTCDSTVNTPAVIDSGTVVVEIGVALTFPAEFVVLRVGQTQSGTAVTYVG